MVEKYIKLLKTKLQFALQIMSNRRKFKKKYIKRIFIKNMVIFADAKRRINIDIPEDQLMEFIPKKLLPMTMMLDEIAKLEYQPKKTRKKNNKSKKKRSQNKE